MDTFMQNFTTCFSSVQQVICSGDLSWQAMLRPSTINMDNGSFRILRQIGEGGYSFVYQVQKAETQDMYALKKLMLAGEEQLVLARREANTLERLRNPHLLPLLHQCFEINKDPASNASYIFYMLFPLYQTSLFDEVLRRKDAGHPFTGKEISLIFDQVCIGLEAMHSLNPPLAHRDIKPQNILLKTANPDKPPLPEMQRSDEIEKTVPLCEGANHWIAAITDFGSAIEARIQITNRQEAIQLQENAEAYCSAPYRAPELFDVDSQCQIDERIDVWSLGCVLYFCLCGVSPFEREFGASMALAVQNGVITWPENIEIDEGLKDLVMFCLNLDPAERPFVKEIRAKLQTYSADFGT